MEWFPSHITKREEDYNPDGTAVITVNNIIRTILAERKLRAAPCIRSVFSL